MTFGTLKAYFVFQDVIHLLNCSESFQVIATWHNGGIPVSLLYLLCYNVVHR